MKLYQVAIAATICIVLIVAVLPIIDPESRESLNMEYDDYRPIGEATEADGALEIVTIDGLQYIHAKDVGEGSLKYANGEVEYFEVNKAKLDIVFALGQSNNTYLNADISQVDHRPNLGTSYYFGTASAPANGKSYGGGTFQTFYDSDGALKVGDKLPDFCYEYTETTGHKVYYVIGASGSTSIVDWVKGASAWTNAKTVLTLALNQIDRDLFEIGCTSVTWIQGESSRYVSQEDYISDFLNLSRSLHDNSMGLRFAHTFIALPMKYANPILAQEKLGELYSDISVVTDISSTFTQENGLLGPDGLHYSQLGYNLIGTELGQACGEWAANQDHDTSSSILHIVPFILIVSALMLVVGAVTSARARV